MTKKEVLNDIIYDLKMKDQVSFEVDAQSFYCEKLPSKGYSIQNEFTEVIAKNLTEVRKEISKLGKNLLWL